MSASRWSGPDRQKRHIINFKNAIRRQAHIEVTDDLLRQLQWFRGEPALDQWQEEFLTSMVRQLQGPHGGLMSISRKQWTKIHEIQMLIERVDGCEPQPSDEDWDPA